MFKRYYCLLLIVGLLSSCATSGHHAVSKSEREQRALEIFAAFDTNGDGYLTREELSGGMRLAGLPDLNPNLVLGLSAKTESKKKTPKANRKLTEAEIQKTMKEAFDRRDAGLDQRLSQDEFKKLVVERPANEGDDPWAPFM